MSCLSPDNLSYASTEMSAPLCRNLFSPFSDASSSSNAMQSVTKQKHTSRNKWLENATANSLERRRRLSRSPLHHRVSSMERRRVLEHSRQTNSASPSHYHSPSHSIVSSSTEERLNWALNHSSDRSFSEDLKSGSGFLSTPSSGDENRFQSAIESKQSNLLPISLDDQQQSLSHTDGNYRQLGDTERKLTNELIEAMIEIFHDRFDEQAVNFTRRHFAQLRDIADIARIIDDVDDEEWLLVFIGELEIHLNDLLRSEGRKGMKQNPRNEFKKKQTLLEVSLDLIRYLKERCRWTLSKKASMDTTSTADFKDHDDASTNTLQCMKSLAASTSKEINMMSEWQHKLSRLSQTVDQYLEILQFTKRSKEDRIEDIDHTAAEEKTYTELHGEVSLKQNNTSSRTPRPKPRNKTFIIHIDKVVDQTLNKENFSTSSGSLTPTDLTYHGDMNYDQNHRSSSNAFSEGSGEIVASKLNSDSIANNDFSHDTDSYYQQTKYPPIQSHSRATKCICPGEINSAKKESTFCSSHNMLCNKPRTSPDRHFVTQTQDSANCRATKFLLDDAESPSHLKHNDVLKNRNNVSPNSFDTSYFPLDDDEQNRNDISSNLPQSMSSIFAMFPSSSNHTKTRSADSSINCEESLNEYLGKKLTVKSHCQKSGFSNAIKANVNVSPTNCKYPPIDISIEVDRDGTNYSSNSPEKVICQSTNTSNDHENGLLQVESTTYLARRFIPILPALKNSNEAHLSPSNSQLEHNDNTTADDIVNSFAKEKENFSFGRQVLTSSNQKASSHVSRWDGIVENSSEKPNFKVEIVSTATSSVQCDIVSKNELTKSNKEIKKLKESSELLRRGITEAREDRDEKDRKIAILETRVQRLKKNMEANQMERGSTAVELERLQRLLHKKQSEWDFEKNKLQETCRKLEEEAARASERIDVLQEYIKRLKFDKDNADKQCKTLEEEKNELEKKLFETTVALMNEKQRNRTLYVENLNLEQQVFKWKTELKLKSQENARKDERNAVSKVLNDVINAVVEEQTQNTEEDVLRLKNSLEKAKSLQVELCEKNEELRGLLNNEKDQTAAATDCFRQQIEFLSNEVSLQRETARLQKEQYDNEIQRMFLSKSDEYNPSSKGTEDGEVDSLRSQLVYQETLTRTLFAENERLREERDELRRQSSPIKSMETHDFACQVEDTSYTKMKAYDFYLQEALRNARRLNDRGNQLQKDTMHAARKTRKLEFEVSIATHQ